MRGDDETVLDDVVEVSLPADPTAAARAREVVRKALTRWRLPHQIESCVLVVSELVTNAVRHGRPPLGLRLRKGGRVVTLDVHDQGAADPVPAPREADDLAESGRGLAIVSAIADEAKIETKPGKGTSAHVTWRLPRH